MNTFLGSSDRYRDVFSRHRIYISKISHEFPRYRSMAGKYIKNRPHTLQCFADFFANVFGRFSRLYYHVHCTITCFADFCCSGQDPVSRTQKRRDRERHKVHIYLEYVPSSELGPPHPLSRKRVWGGATHSPAGEGVGVSMMQLLQELYVSQ
jgi:hypothetical protein